MAIEHRSLAVIGAGPAGLMAADVASSAGLKVTLYEAMPSPARKFLMAGKSGLNLTYDQPLDAFMGRYRHLGRSMEQAIADFGPEHVINFTEALKQEVFTGSSGRVFPKAMKASPMVRAWLARLSERGVALERRHKLVDLTAGPVLTFETPKGPQNVKPDLALLALGGGSWQRLGSTGEWQALEELKSLSMPFKAANCGLTIKWPAHFEARIVGAPLKTVRVTAVGPDQNPVEKQGDVMVTATGLEGGPIYEVCHAFQDLPKGTHPSLEMDLAPGQTLEALTARLSQPRGKRSLSNHLRRASRLPPEKLAFLKAFTTKDAFREPERVAKAIKSLQIPVHGLAALDGAISTAGGLRQDALDGFAVPTLAGVYVAGEMLDWDAPTGGYLITACLASGRAAALQAVASL